MKCFYNQAEVSYPCSAGCHLFADCMLEWVRKTERKIEEGEAAPSEERKRKTNFDRIREMSVEEFSKKFVDGFDCENCEENGTLCKRTCTENYRDWLVKDWEE